MKGKLCIRNIKRLNSKPQAHPFDALRDPNSKYIKSNLQGSSTIRLLLYPTELKMAYEHWQ